ncbi:MAG: hypothetical protein ACREIC_10170, partial [Limisphaerales bacterium]
QVVYAEGEIIQKLCSFACLVHSRSSDITGNATAVPATRSGADFRAATTKRIRTSLGCCISSLF